MRELVGFAVLSLCTNDFFTAELVQDVKRVKLLMFGSLGF